MTDEEKRDWVLFLVEFGQGMSLVKAHDAETAALFLERRYGTANGPYEARKATPNDERYVKAFGGKVHIAATLHGSNL